MRNVTFEITDVQYKVLANQAMDPQDWVENAVGHLVELAKDQMVTAEVERMLADPGTTLMTTDRDEIVQNYNGSLIGNPNG
jgi:hypothetical protein